MSPGQDNNNDALDSGATRLNRDAGAAGGASPVSDDDLGSGATLKGFQPGLKLFGQRYELIKQVGRGGMGVVWLARDHELGSEVALKFLPELMVTDDEAIADLKQETRHCMVLAHPNIVRVNDFLREDKAAAVSMEFIKGGTLQAAKLEKDNRCFSTEELAPWIEQVCAALEYAHSEARIVHRDIKPSNVMVEEGTGRVKLADFGISRSLSDTMTRNTRGNSPNTSGGGGGGWTGGTLVYMSPQHLTGYPPSVADDIYALGATIYELLTGKPPFYTGSIERQIDSVVPPSMAERRVELGVEGAGKIPRAWEEAVASCLAKTPEERPQSVAAVWEALTGRVLVGSVAKREKRGSGKKLGVLATVVVLATGALAGWWHGVETPRRAAVELAEVEARQQGESKA